MHDKIIKHKKKDFSFVFKNRLLFNRSFYRGSYVSLYIVQELQLAKYQGIVRIGLAVSKKIEKAAKRNKIKRRLRMLAREVILNIDNLGFYYIIIANRNIRQANYQNLKKDLIICLQNLN